MSPLNAARAVVDFYWKAETRPLHEMIDSILARNPGAISDAADSWFVCALAERDPTAAERALVALGDNPCWGDDAVNLSRSFGEGLLARMMKDEAKARAAFSKARAEQEKIVQAQPEYGPAALRARPDRRRSGTTKRPPWRKDGARSNFFPWKKIPSMAAACLIQYFAITAAWTGEKDLALQQLEIGTRAPSASQLLSYGALKLLPFWDLAPRRSRASRKSSRHSPK